jgi:hypothetical protein
MAMTTVLRSVCVAVLTALLACCAADAGVGAVEIALKDKAEVSRDVVELGDVATLGEGASPEVVHLALGSAPWAGSARRI